jgi:hypothetical protein
VRVKYNKSLRRANEGVAKVDMSEGVAKGDMSEVVTKGIVLRNLVILWGSVVRGRAELRDYSREMLIFVILAQMSIISEVTLCGFDQWKKLYIACWGLSLDRRSKEKREVVLLQASLKKGVIHKNFDYSVLFARGLAYPGTRN